MKALLYFIEGIKIILD
jgi:hypothetical protein